ncbi:unnamed protein product [Clonostachys byssicola]|uniref:Allantoin permease n=1 Tax=Clonostachys byssicola TaxID=160290 RepID=A0A9N9YDA0_9HYPO|nr:unnamed protein product [Clonostachys byssicola]
MGPFAAICIVDCFFVARGNLFIRELYVGNADSRYWYWKGCNLRAIAAWVIGIVLPFPGFVATFGTVTVSSGAQQTWNLGLVMSGVVYYALSISMPTQTLEKSHAFEELDVETDMIIDSVTYIEEGAANLDGMHKRGSLDKI